jgi:RNA polymerase sigma-70 factor (ECF subfamily)
VKVSSGERVAALREDQRLMADTRRGGEGVRGQSASQAREDPDQPLLERLAQGDRRAYALLVGRHMGRMFGLARRMLGNESDAEDVTQEAFLRVWRYAKGWKPGQARFETWLYRVTLNLCYDRLRRRREITVEEMPEVLDERPSVIEVHASRDVVRAVEGALARLPERQRAALVLCHYQELSNAEAAALLDVTVEALESLLARGRRMLRNLLADCVDALLEEG